MPEMLSNPITENDEARKAFEDRIEKEVTEFMDDPEKAILKLAHAHAERMLELRLRMLSGKVRRHDREPADSGNGGE